MRLSFAAVVAVLSIAACSPAPAPEDLSAEIGGFDHLEGYYDLYWDAAKGRLIIRIVDFDTDFLYQSSLARGIGSNDIGLDRGQLGATRVVSFQRSGPKVLLMEKNLRYRAVTDDVDERRAVDESFARSVVWGFEVLGEMDGSVYVDGTDFFLRDAHGIVPWLEKAGEGTYQLDATRSAIYMPRSKAFPDNTEVEAVVSFTGKPTGTFLPTVVPDPTTITVHMHHSFIRLPDDKYSKVKYDPRAGIIGLDYGSNGFLDYATAIGEPLTIAYGRRHRLQKKDPAAAISEAVEPIVYYVDRAAPEPVRAALIEGASWWNEAFEAAGYKDAFRVELMPEGADPMDVRYNVIQWVHRSTRGWSYGSSVLDPRTGEIMKGHVTLGSLRVRQDYLIAEGLLAPYDDDSIPDKMLEMSLARIRQLAAHEVGHTLGFEHNFAASTQDRSSVMDYPFPLIRFDAAGDLDLSDAYGRGIGDWDKRVVLYAYQDFPDDENADLGRDRIIAETLASGLKYVSDEDSRDVGTAQPDGNLWDNGPDAIDELNHLLRVRKYALGRFSEKDIRMGRPLATLEEVLVPVYLLHRYQLQAVGKLIGGQYFSYAMRGDGQTATRQVSPVKQRAAVTALLGTLDPSLLRLPDALLALLPARPPGSAKSRETFPNHTGATFDPLGPAQSAAALTLEVLLNPARAARMVAANAVDQRMPGFHELTAALLAKTWFASRPEGVEAAIQRSVDDLALQRLLRLSADAAALPDVRAMALESVNTLDNWMTTRLQRETDSVWRAHYTLAQQTIRQAREDPSSLEKLPPPVVPPGSPVGSTVGLSSEAAIADHAIAY
jgi:hypothetical protein